MCQPGLSWRTCRDLLSSSAERVRAGVETVEREEAPGEIVMGLDQHRAQITADWLDTETGEVTRARVAPADRAGVRRFLARFRGQQLEVALEATTGWRFVVEELRRVGARGASGRAGGDRGAARDQEARQERSRRRAASARAVDGRAAAGVVDPARSHPRSARAGQAAAHALEQRREWQQRIQAVLYHHGVPQRAAADDRRRARVAGRAAAAGERRASRSRSRWR